MLQFLSINNFALIDRLEVSFEGGLNLITGETGSGKSILVDAFGLLLGSRASQQMIRQGSPGARVEGLFHLAADHPACQFLAQAEIDSGEGELVIRREIAAGGSSKVFVNNRLVPLSMLAGLGTLLADIHGQHDQQLLLDSSSHLDFLDAFAGLTATRASLAEIASLLAGVRRRQSLLSSKDQERLQRQDLLRFQIDEIERLDLTPGLDLELREESRLLASAQQRQGIAATIYTSLYDSESSLVGAVGAAEQQLAQLAELDPQMADALEPSREARFQLEELAYRLRDYADGVASDPRRLDEIEERLAAIQKACRKYAPSVDELLAYLEQRRQELTDLEGAAERGQELEEELEALGGQWREAAARLSTQRAAAAGKLASAVVSELAELAMPDTRFEVQLLPSEEPYQPHGAERAEFLMSANRGEEPRPLARIASGGEISRVMLALKSLLTVEEQSKTLVFDEVDSGIGGRVADGLGRRLAALAGRHQVFCVTHLPQIAAYANRHLNVSKRDDGTRTVVTLEVLDEHRRVEELSRMLAGEEITDAARRHAVELLKTAR